MDYKLLLKKYIQHIVECEGSDYVARMLTYYPDEPSCEGDVLDEFLIFSEAEIKEITKLSGFDER